MKKNALLKTNMLISIILIVGFIVTGILSYQANYRTSLEHIEQVSSLTTEGIYYQLTTMFTRPVNISLTMSHDSLLVEHFLNEMGHLNDKEYIQKTKTYLQTYQEKYGFDSVFLVSSATKRYYNFNGVDRILTDENPENEWYYELLESDKEYSLNVDNDEVDGADNAITVFVNCKVKDADDSVLGIVGVGIRISYLKDLLKEYEKKFNVEASLINEDGTIEISTTYTGYEQKNWFHVYKKEKIHDDILNWKEEETNLELWTSSGIEETERSYIVTRYIKELSWHLIIEKNTGKLRQEMKNQLYQSCFLIMIVIAVVLSVITTVITKFNRKIAKLMEEKQESFKTATEQLYDNIYELNITKNCPVGKRTEEYFESLGAKDVPYDEGLRIIAKKQIKTEYQEGYISIFKTENVIQEYKKGNNHLQYDFMITQDGVNYNWMRIDAYIFYSTEDRCIHMFTYRKNINLEKQKELQAKMDEMTRFYTKRATEKIIEDMLLKRTENMYAFFIFDIDNFKQANDCFGHAFGDFCIKEFTRIIREHFKEGDILGRIGGDEFVAFTSIMDIRWVEEKAKELSRALNIMCVNQLSRWNMSASIGVAIAPMEGMDFITLYRNADAALYETKQRGKNGFTIYKSHPRN